VPAGVGPGCVVFGGRTWAAGLSFGLASVFRRLHQPPIGIKAVGVFGERNAPGPWRRSAPQKVLELSRLCPFRSVVQVCGCPGERDSSTLWLTADAQADHRIHEPERVHSGLVVFPGTISGSRSGLLSCEEASRVEGLLASHDPVGGSCEFVGQRPGRHDGLRLGPLALQVSTSGLVMSNREMGSL
jgi:hypothetical protein